MATPGNLLPAPSWPINETMSTLLPGDGGRETLMTARVDVFGHPSADLAGCVLSYMTAM